MRKALFIAFILFSFQSHSQGLEYDITNDGELIFSFKPEFIQEKNIKTITSEFSKKRPNEIVKPVTNSTKRLSYYKSGHISETKSRTYISSSKIETHQRFFYTDSLLIQKIELDHVGYYSEFHTYHEDTCFIDIYRSKDYTSHACTANDSTFISSKALITTSDNIKELNSKLLEVNKTTFTHDTLGLLKRTFTQHTFSPLLIDKHYDYNENGKVDQIELASITTRKTFELIYDNLTSLQTIKYYLNDELVTKYEVVYNSDGWVSAFLKHDVSSHIIEIEKLEYTFHR